MPNTHINLFVGSNVIYAERAYFTLARTIPLIIGFQRHNGRSYSALSPW